MQKPATEKFMKDHGLTCWGEPNKVPTPYVECDIMKFWNKFAVYGIRETEFDQVYLDGKLTSVHFLIYHDVIFMIVMDYIYNKETGKGYYPKCFQVGCQHEWTEISTRHGDHWRTCAKCGYQYYYDSSG